MNQQKADSMLSWNQFRRMFAIVSAAQKPLNVLQLCAVLQSAEKQQNETDHPFMLSDDGCGDEFAIGGAVDLKNDASVKLTVVAETVRKAGGMLRLTRIDGKSAINAEVTQKLAPSDGIKFMKHSQDIIVDAIMSTVEIFHKSVQDWMKEENADYGNQGSSQVKPSVKSKSTKTSRHRLHDLKGVRSVVA